MNTPVSARADPSGQAVETIALHARPAGRVAEAIVDIARLLTPEWFTPNVPDDIRRDLAFHDALCLWRGEQLVSFLVFTSLDGALNITLMGARPSDRGRGYGSALMERFFEHARALRYERVVAMTVPPDVKPAYAATVQFYQRHGFVITRRYNELWESGAIELTRRL
jgi:GNAT superfamily N-acetyltransferase